MQWIRMRFHPVASHCLSQRHRRRGFRCAGKGAPSGSLDCENQREPAKKWNGAGGKRRPEATSECELESLGMGRGGRIANGGRQSSLELLRVSFAGMNADSPFCQARVWWRKRDSTRLFVFVFGFNFVIVIIDPGSLGLRLETRAASAIGSEPQAARHKADE